MAFSRRLALSAAFVATAALLLSNLAQAQTFVSGYSSKQALQPGMVVSLSKDSKTAVELTPGGDDGKIYGVVVDPAEATATIAQEGQDVFVATIGRYSVLASIENGMIEAGDYLSMSTTDGLVAKAGTSQLQIVGRALENYDGSANVLTQTASGSAIGVVLADIAPGKNPLRSETLVPGPLRQTAEAIAGKSVSAVRLYGALAVFVATLIVGGAVLWVGVRSGIIAIGRNPLSRGSAYKAMAQVLVVAVLIFAVGVIGVYLLLKL